MVMTKNKRMTVIAACFVFIIFVAYLGVNKTREANRLGECIRTQPLVCTRGGISNSPGMFSSGPVVYRLWFKGKTSKSGEMCEIVRRVTEAQFNKWMY